MENLFENISENDLQIVPEYLTNAEPKKIADKIVNILDIKKGGDIKLLEVHSRTVIADYFVICTANSTTQVKSLADELEYQMTLCNTPPAHTDGMAEANGRCLTFHRSSFTFSLSQQENFTSSISSGATPPSLR